MFPARLPLWPWYWGKRFFFSAQWLGSTKNAFSSKRSGCTTLPLLNPPLLFSECGSFITSIIPQNAVAVLLLPMNRVRFEHHLHFSSSNALLRFDTCVSLLPLVNECGIPSTYLKVFVEQTVLYYH